MQNKHVINVTKKDIFEQLWAALPFVPIVILYSQAILYVDNLLEFLQRNEIIRQINVFAGYGLSTLILILVTEAAKKSENDFIAGPIQVLNLYSFFYVGLLLEGWQFAFIGVAFYLLSQNVNLPLLNETSNSKNEWIKFRELGMTRKYFVLKHYIFEPLANFVSMAISYWLVQSIIPVEQWIHLDFVSQIKFLTLQIGIWSALHEILYALYFQIVPIRDFPESLIVFLIVAFPPVLLFWTVNKITIGIYIAAYIFAWFSLGVFAFQRIREGGNMKIGNNVRGYKQ